VFLGRVLIFSDARGNIGEGNTGYLCAWWTSGTDSEGHWEIWWWSKL